MYVKLYGPEDGQTTLTQCMSQFGVKYPVFDKIDANGDNAHPLFHYLKQAVDCPEFVRETTQQKMLYNHIQQNYPDYLIGRNIRWNFTKFLVERNGRVIQRFEPDSSFLDIEQAIEAVLSIEESHFCSINLITKIN